MGKAKLEYPRGLDFEQVWAAINRTSANLDKADARIDKSQERLDQIEALFKETDRQIKENGELIKETDRQMKETDRQIKDYNKRFGEFTNRFGEIVEYMVAPNLREKFRELGFNFPKANSNPDISDTEHNIFLEVDVMLENGEKAMLVETKTKPTIKDVKDHIKRIEKMRVYTDLHGDKRKFMGAIAGVVLIKDVRQYILQQGLFAIEPSGETFNIFPPEGSPREW